MVVSNDVDLHGGGVMPLRLLHPSPSRVGELSVLCWWFHCHCSIACCVYKWLVLFFLKLWEKISLQSSLVQIWWSIMLLRHRWLVRSGFAGVWSIFGFWLRFSNLLLKLLSLMSVVESWFWYLILSVSIEIWSFHYIWV